MGTDLADAVPSSDVSRRLCHQQTETYLCLLITSSMKGTLEKVLVKSAKYLGLNVDNKLNFNIYFMFRLLKRLTQLLFSLDPEDLCETHP